MSTYKIIHELASTRSSNEKKNILLREVNNEELKTFFRLALSNRIRFYQKKEISSSFKVDNFISLLDAMKYIEEHIALRKITGNAAKHFIKNLLSEVSVENEYVLKLILQKKSGCDLGASIVNKIWPKLITEFPCLLATNWDDKLSTKLFASSDKIYSQKKSDGLRVALVIDEEGNVSAYTRAGNELNVFGVFDYFGEFIKGVVIDGELLTINNDTGKFNNRQTSNGICSKAIHDTMSEEESKMLHMTAWDMIPIDDFKREYSDIEYSSRFASLYNFVISYEVGKHISVIDSKIVKSPQEAQDHYQEMIYQGEEGTVVKSSKMLWENKRSKLQLKVKSEFLCDLKVIGYIPGKGELEGNLGALMVESNDSKVQVNISGFSLKLRSEIFANLIDSSVNYQMVINDELQTYTALPGDSDIYIDSIVEVKYNSKIKSRDSDIWSLFLPRFEKSRPDKLLANNFDEIK